MKRDCHAFCKKHFSKVYSFFFLITGKVFSATVKLITTAYTETLKSSASADFISLRLEVEAGVSTNEKGCYVLCLGLVFKAR